MAGTLERFSQRCSVRSTLDRLAGLLASRVSRDTKLITALALLLIAQFARADEAFKRFKPFFDADGQLVVAAANVAEAPYNADATGKADVSAILQRAMGDVSGHGGGTIFLPAGRYRLDHRIVMPATITLCGQWKKPEPGQPLTGTVLLAYADKNNPDAPALISPPECGHANVYNLCIYYPAQNPLQPIPYPFSIDARVAYIHNITLVNSYQGIMMSVCSGSSVSNIYGTALKRGLVLKGSSELCSCTHVRLGSDYWTGLPEAAMAAKAKAAVHAFMTNELTALQIGKVDGLSLCDADVVESKTPVLVKKEKDEQKWMIAPWNQYGFGGGLGRVQGRRTDVDLDGWYFGTHYFDLDNYPEFASREYAFAPMGQAARQGQDAVYQADDFGVKADGSSDDSAALQRGLEQAGKAGGGTVLLPRGVVVLKGRVTIPAGVELRGGYLGVPVRSWYNKISTLIIDCDADTSDPANAPAAISLQERAGLRGVNISHAKNLWELDNQGQLVIHPYPYAIRGLGKEVYVCDVSITNAYHGIDLGAACDGAQVVGLWGTMFHDGIRVGGGSDRVRLENINIDVGPLESDCRFAEQFPPTKNRHDVLQKYLGEHAVNFVLGDCTRLTTFNLAGFAPHRFMEFIDQGKGGCRDAEFWSSIFDVPQVELARFSGGGHITFNGLFATGGRDDHSLWAEFDPSFTGKVDVYGLCQQLRFNNRPFAVGPEKLQIHLEHSLTTRRPIQASSAAAGFPPENAVDGDARTLWQSDDSIGPHELTVQLAEPSIITRLRVHGAGTFLPAAQNVDHAKLLGSGDGSTYFEMAAFRGNRQDWVDMPVTCEKPVCFVRLQVIRGEKPGTGLNRARIAQFDVFGQPAGLQTGIDRMKSAGKP